MAERPVLPEAISLNIDPGFDTRSLLDSAPGVINNDEPLKHRLGEERFRDLTNFVQRLLRGEVFPQHEIEAKGLDPGEVMRKTKGLLRNSQFGRHGAASAERRMSYVRPSWVGERPYQDPTRFLRDGSGRND